MKILFNLIEPIKNINGYGTNNYGYFLSDFTEDNYIILYMNYFFNEKYVLHKIIVMFGTHNW